MEIILYLVYAVLLGGGIFVVYQLFVVSQQKKRIEWLSSQKYTIIRVDVPKNNEKAPLAAEQMFASLHGIYSESSSFQNHLSFEIVSKDKYIRFYIYVPTHLKDFVEGQVYAQYPTVEINEVDDYSKSMDVLGKYFACSELKTTKEDVYPIKLFSDFEVDPISGITSVMSKLNPGEEVWLQVIIRPVGDEWQEKGNRLIMDVKSGNKPGSKSTFGKVSSVFIKWLKMLVVQAIYPGNETSDTNKTVELPGTVEEALKGVEYKIQKLGYETKIRIITFANDPTMAKIKNQSVGATFKQYNTTNGNGFKTGEIKINDDLFYHEYVYRMFEDSGSIFNIGELASIYHFPHQTVETPNIVWSGSKKGEPPANLPIVGNIPDNDITTVGETTYRNVFKKFGIKMDDRRRHFYIIGKSGVGKSVLMENMALDDVKEGRGVIVVDPHGEFADKILACIPDNRVDDVVVFDPADRAYPIAFNLLEHVEDDFKGMVASGFVGIFKKIFGFSWGPRLEHILRNTVLALLDFPESTMLDIPRMLTEAGFRNRVVEKVKDPVIKEFWVNEFGSYDNKFRTEAVSPILNKVGQFLATATIRNIVGQAQSTLDIRHIMDNKKIMIVNLSRGKIGEDNSALLGAMMITKIQLAAMSRADITADSRADCYLYVDEFQNFATESFAVILSEARKYHLNLNIANQYITQMPEEVRDAVFGNAGTIVSFRVGGADADFLVKEFEPVFSENDLVNLDKYNVYIKLLIDGVSSPAFSAKTLPPVDILTGNADKVIELSRKKYAKTREEVESRISDRTQAEIDLLKREAEAFKKGGLGAILVSNKNDIDRTRIFSSPKQFKDEEPKKENIQMKNTPVHEKKEQEKQEIQKQSTEGIEKNREDKKEDKREEAAIEEGKTANTDETSTYERKPKYLKYQNIIGDKIYKEHTARGGVRWYLGKKINLDELEESGVVITDEAKKMINLAKKVGDSDKSNTDDKKTVISKRQEGEMKKQDEVMPKKEVANIKEDNKNPEDVGDNNKTVADKKEEEKKEEKYDDNDDNVDSDTNKETKAKDQDKTEDENADSGQTANKQTDDNTKTENEHKNLEDKDNSQNDPASLDEGQSIKLQ